MCYLATFVERSVSHTSILTILAITVERYYAICQPLKAGEVCTKSRACLICLIAWIAGFGLTTPILAMIEYQALPGKTHFSIMKSLLVNVISFLLFVIT